MVMRAAGVNQLWALPVWSVAKGGLKKKTESDPHLLSC